MRGPFTTAKAAARAAREEKRLLQRQELERRAFQYDVFRVRLVMLSVAVFILTFCLLMTGR